MTDNYESQGSEVEPPQADAPDQHDANMSERETPSNHPVANTTMSPQVARLKERKDGPYYIAPDSVEPAPSGMWSGLDPNKVEAAAAIFPQVQTVERDPETGAVQSIPVPKPQRDILEAGGTASHLLLRALERGL
jgi:hypothetical protein